MGINDPFIKIKDEKLHRVRSGREEECDTQGCSECYVGKGVPSRLPCSVWPVPREDSIIRIKWQVCPGVHGHRWKARPSGLL